MRRLPALRLTREAARRLAPGRAGRVHSAYARTLNLVLDGSGDGDWVSLHGPGPIASPFGITCGAMAAAPELAGAPVRVDPRAVYVDGALELEVTGAAVVETGVREGAPLPPATAEGLPLYRLAAPTLATLAAATAGGDAVGCLAAARRLVGLGPGLTPAGDDCLVGWLAALHAAGARGRALLALVAAELLATARARTTALSGAFLAAAIAGVVAEPVHAFVATPDAAHRAALLALGATSGADCLAGYVLGRLALA